RDRGDALFCFGTLAAVRELRQELLERRGVVGTLEEIPGHLVGWRAGRRRCGLLQRLGGERGDARLGLGPQRAVRELSDEALECRRIAGVSEKLPGHLVGARPGRWRRNDDRRCFLEIDRLLRQRAVDERLLLALGRLDDVVADVAEQEVDL